MNATFIPCWQRIVTWVMRQGERTLANRDPTATSAVVCHLLPREYRRAPVCPACCHFTAGEQAPRGSLRCPCREGDAGSTTLIHNVNTHVERLRIFASALLFIILTNTMSNNMQVDGQTRYGMQWKRDPEGALTLPGLDVYSTQQGRTVQVQRDKHLPASLGY